MKLPRSSLFVLTTATIALVLVGSVGPVGGQGNASPTLTILSREGRRALPLSVINDQELVFLDDLASAFQLTVREDSLGTLTVAYKDKTILLSDQPLASIAGRLVSLPSAPTRSGRRWLVPVEFINRAIGLVHDSRIDLRKPSRLVVVGDLRVPRVTIRVDGGDPTRIVIETVPRSTSAAVSQEANALAVKFDADALDAAVPAFQPQALVRAIRLVEPATVAIDLGPRFMAFRAVTEPLDNSMRLTIDLLSAAREAQPATPPQTTQAVPAPEAPDISVLSQPHSLRTVALDPGHGGEDEGVRGLNGAKEKDLALAVARKVKATIESRLGIRVLLTRDDDRNVSLNARAAMANNNKADLFISLHANASFSPAVTGASILYAAFDREVEQSAHSSLGSVKLPTFGGGQRDIDLVLWDLAQIRHIDRSAELSKLLEAEFKPRIPLSTYATERLPLSVLESANMPAVLIEMGYLSNADQEKRMAGNEFQNTLAQAVYDAVVKFRDMIQAGAAR